MQLVLTSKLLCMEMNESVPNAERNIDDIERELQDYVESNGRYLNVIEKDEGMIRFQIWKDPNGLPIMETEMHGYGAAEELAILSERYSEDKGFKVEQKNLGQGIINFVITKAVNLDKKQEIG